VVVSLVSHDLVKSLLPASICTIFTTIVFLLLARQTPSGHLEQFNGVVDEIGAEENVARAATNDVYRDGVCAGDESSRGDGEVIDLV